MASNPLQSAGRRFFQKFGVAFFWAIVFGSVFGGAAYFRVERRELTGDPRWHVVARLWLERLEWLTYDWRARELGAASTRSDAVVLVNVDDETIASAREQDQPQWAMRPWPRDLSGVVIEQALQEGAALVLFDQSLADVSPHHCAPCKGESRKGDDDLLGDRLERVAGKAVLSWGWSPERAKLGERPLTPTLLRVADGEGESSVTAPVREVLRHHAPAYVTNEAGRRVVWAGVESEAKAKELASALELKQVTTRGLTPADDQLEVDASWLVQHLAAVQVPGLDVAKLTKARSLQAPVAAVLSPTTPTGAGRLVPDSDGRVRAVPLLISSEDGAGAEHLLASAPLLAVMQLAGTRALRWEAGTLFIGDKLTVPVDSEGYLALSFDTDDVARPDRGTVKRALPAFRLLVNHRDDEAGRGVRHHDNELAGKVIVLFDEGGRDPLVSTSVGPLTTSAVQAQAIANLLSGVGISRVTPEVDFWFTVLFSFGGAVLAVAWSSIMRRPGWLAWVATLAAIAVIQAVVARQLFVEQHRWVSMAAPFVACSLTFLATLGYARTLEQGLRDFVLRALGGAVRADVVSRVERDLALMQPERRELTIYISDIEGFTNVAQQQDPGAVVGVLQQYLHDMTNLVLDAKGHVDKYLGDGMMAFWGAPVELDDQVAEACDAAIKMRAAFEAKRATWEKRCNHRLTMRAGIDAGATVVGEMGTLHRVNYTVMGEAVTAAFRLETLAKRYDTRILVGPRVPGRAGETFAFREVDTVRLRASESPVTIYELVGRRDALGDDMIWLEHWGRAMAAWHARRFDEAAQLFHAAAQHRDDALATRYLKRCALYAATPPPEPWDGTFDHPKKSPLAYPHPCRKTRPRVDATGGESPCAPSLRVVRSSAPARYGRKTQ